VTVALPLTFTAQEPSSNIATLTPVTRPATADQTHQVKKSA